MTSYNILHGMHEVEEGTHRTVKISKAAEFIYLINSNLRGKKWEKSSVFLTCLIR